MNVIVMLVMALCFGACGDNVRPLTLVGPDAGPDADPGCCRYLPEQDAVRACVAADLKPGVCGVIACPEPDGSFTRLNVCGSQPPDAGP